MNSLCGWFSTVWRNHGFLCQDSLEDLRVLGGWGRTNIAMCAVRPNSNGDLDQVCRKPCDSEVKNSAPPCLNLPESICLWLNSCQDSRLMSGTCITRWNHLCVRYAKICSAKTCCSCIRQVSFGFSLWWCQFQCDGNYTSQVSSRRRPPKSSSEAFYIS